MRHTVLLCSCLFWSLPAFDATAAFKWWDPNGTFPATSGIWDTTTSNWSTSGALSGTRTTFVNGDFAAFAAGTVTIPSLNITVNSAVTCSGMGTGLGGATVSALTFSGTGSIGIASGTQGFYCGPATSILTFNVPITGAGGLEPILSGSIALYASNSYSGGTVLSGGQIIYYNNNNSFGSGAISGGNSFNALFNSSSNAITIPNNFAFSTAGYSLDLAGGSPVAGAPGTTFTGYFSLPAGTTTLYASPFESTLVEISGVISGAGAALTKADVGTLELSGANTYTGDTTIRAGTLALSDSGSIDFTPAISIAAGATFDVSAIAGYTLGPDTSLSASGKGTTVGTNAATINGAAGDPVSLGSQPITLTYDGSDPALYISRGTLFLNGNAFTVNSASPLAPGTYAIVQQAGGSIDFAGTFSVSGTAIGPGLLGIISINGGTVNLTITGTPPPIPIIRQVSVNGTVLNLSADNGSPSEMYVLRKSTNVALPFSQWTPVLTNYFDSNGLVNLSTNLINPADCQEYYLIQTP